MFRFQILSLGVALFLAMSGAIPLEARQEVSGSDHGRSLSTGDGVLDEMFQGVEILDRQSLIQAVLDRNPGLEAARQAWRAALEREPQARALDDPMVAYEVAPLSVGGAEVRFGQILRVRQRLPFPGKLALRGEATRAEALAAERDYEAVRLELATLASLLFDEYYFLHRALAINDEHIQLLQDFQRIATALYTTGTAALQDPIQAEVEVAHLVHRKIVLGAERDALVARINALLHRRPHAPLPPPPSELPLPEEAAHAALELQEEALAGRPELEAVEARIQGLQAAVALRRRDFYPDFEAMASFNSMWNESEHRWMVGVGINAPIWRGRLRAAVAEAEAQLAQAASERQRLEDEIRAQVHQALVRLEEAHHVVSLYRSRLLPASRDQVKAALAGFKASRNSFLALIEAERNQRTVELDYHRALADYHRRAAELDRALGRLPGGPGQTATVAGDTRFSPAQREGDSP